MEKKSAAGLVCVRVRRSRTHSLGSILVIPKGATAAGPTRTRTHTRARARVHTHTHTRQEQQPPPPPRCTSVARRYRPPSADDDDDDGSDRPRQCIIRPATTSARVSPAWLLCSSRAPHTIVTTILRQQQLLLYRCYHYRIITIHYYSGAGNQPAADQCTTASRPVCAYAALAIRLWRQNRGGKKLNN